MLFFFKGHSNQYTIPGHSCSKGLIVLLTTLSHIIILVPYKATLPQDMLYNFWRTMPGKGTGM